MNIIFLVPEYHPHIGGVERHTRAVAIRLARRGCGVTVFVEKRRDADACLERDNGVEIFRFIKRNYWIFRKLSLKGQFIQRFSTFYKADIVHFHDFSTMWLWGFLVYFLLRCLGKKIFITFHGWEGHVPPRRRAIIKRKICEYLSHGNICAGHFIEKWYGTRADCITYGGCTTTSLPDRQKKRKYALFIGRLEKDTGIRDYIQAWKTVNQLFPELELVICGDGSLRQNLLSTIEKHGIKKIQFRGFVNNPETMLSRSVFVFTSGFLGILEAFSQQTPVIATYDNPLKKDYLTMLPDSDKMLWIGGDLAAIIAAVQDIMGNDISEKINNAYIFAMDNSWEKVTESYLQLYRQHGCHAD